MEYETYNLKESGKGNVTISDNAFSLEWNNDLVHQSLAAHKANSRQKIADTKERGEVSGGGRKPWRQKGTGNARHGSIRSPIWRGGGTTFGPAAEKKYEKKLNKKMKRKALFSVLSQKFREGEIHFVDSLELKNGKTKEAEKIINSLTQYIEGIKKKKVLFIASLGNKSFAMAAHNIKNAKSINPESLNIYELLSHKYVIFDKKSVKEMEKHFL